MFVVSFSPLVIKAFSKLEQYKKQSPDEHFNKVLEERLLEDVGLYFDTKSGQTFDARGNFYRDVTQVDSFMVLLNLMNKTFPCVSPMGFVGKSVKPLVPGHLNDYPCHTPDISDLESRIFFRK
ncbi:MAG: hypothetical protein HYZ33_00610 [Ignavibacteriales bacterium]|nr:hypothetical protein [Ignavibacteriales bacterium]